MSPTPVTVSLAIASLVDGDITFSDVSQILLLAMAAVEQLKHLGGEEKKNFVLQYVTQAMTDSGVPPETIVFTHTIGPAIIETILAASGGAAKLNSTFRHWIVRLLGCCGSKNTGASRKIVRTALEDKERRSIISPPVDATPEDIIR